MKRSPGLVAVAIAAAVAASSGQTPAAGTPPVSDTVRAMNESAERYVRLVLALGQHDKDYVDAFYGPDEWKKDAEAQKRPLPQIRAESAALAVRVGRLPDGGDEMNHLRRRFLRRQLEALTARADIVSGRKMSFDAESRALYDAAAPVNSEDHFRKLRSRLEAELPGKGSLIDRYDAFRKDFVIPRDKLDAVFQAAIAEARAGTRKDEARADREARVGE